jgi:hypothetical protein
MKKHKRLLDERHLKLTGLRWREDRRLMDAEDKKRAQQLRLRFATALVGSVTAPAICHWFLPRFRLTTTGNE